MKITNAIACIFIFLIFSIALNLVHLLIPDGFYYLHYSWIPLQIIIAGVLSYRYYRHMNKMDVMANGQPTAKKNCDSSNENVD